MLRYFFKRKGYNGKQPRELNGGKNAITCISIQSAVSSTNGYLKKPKENPTVLNDERIAFSPFSRIQFQTLNTSLIIIIIIFLKRKAWNLDVDTVSQRTFRPRARRRRPSSICCCRRWPSTCLAPDPPGGGTGKTGDVVGGGGLSKSFVLGESKKKHKIIRQF